ncbi:FMN-dependent alpha-hydroxy acid dehydrogenase [Mycena sanguinolenta]|uniref:FMN-dependent alpha-hydroxy acid dehydrogenase n=1 Tax=Mycena sanguinolenta TaxID=230812 RepID=A0A8H7CVE8_9AGAR|nr:FMN-dependent alpha-hydroxy acid dehydrogenase [Mycena sanguinolenta]
MISFPVLSLLSMLLKPAAVMIDMEGLPDTGLDTSSWKPGVLPSLQDIWDLNDMQIAAKNVLSGKDYAYYRTGSLNEYTYQANLGIYSKIKINGFGFRDVSNLQTSTTILGYNFSYPFFIAPAAKAGRANKSAEASLASAAGKSGILYVPSISSTLSIEKIAQAGVEGQVMFHQEYIWANTSQVIDELDRIKAAGFKAIFLTVDNTGINGIRTRSMRYTTDSDMRTSHAANFDLDSLAAFRNLTDLPIVPKGIKTWQDALACLHLGFPAIYVSNHGGRVLDGVPTSVEILLDIRKHAPEVFEGMEVYADGGVRRGTDALILLALGARAVGLGRPPMFANIWGEEGVLRLIDLFGQEMKTSMQLMGVSNVNKLNSSYVSSVSFVVVSALSDF